MTKILCIYHGGCDDGFGAAWAVWKALGDAVEFFPGVYQVAPPDVTGRQVLLVDFSYKRPVVNAMRAKAQSILILDHHKTALEELDGFPPPPPSQPDLHGWIPGSGVYCELDMTRSGAAMAWDHFHGPYRPALIEYIQDRDLWRKQLPSVDEFIFALRSYPQDFEVWDDLSGRTEQLISEGRTIRRFYRQQCEAVKRHAYRAMLGGVECLVANAPYSMASEVAGDLAKESTFGACYFEIGPGSFQYSLRSHGDFDVSEIAEQFGGGGHKNAAGFAVTEVAHISAEFLKGLADVR